jgi:hypothetical protein
MVIQWFERGVRNPAETYQRVTVRRPRLRRDRVSRISMRIEAATSTTTLNTDSSGKSRSGLPRREVAALHWSKPSIYGSWNGEHATASARLTIWRRQSELIARREQPSAAIEQWWAIDDAIQPLEMDIGKAVAEYDDRINAEVHDRR